MKTKMLLVLSASLNVTLLGAVTYLSRQIPAQDYMPPDIRFVAKSGFSSGNDAADQTGSGPRFGAVVEALLPSPRHAGQPELFDLETRRRMTEPDFEFFGQNAEANINWIRTNGLDISGFVHEAGEVVCIGYYLAVLPVDSRRWEEATPADILADPELARLRDPKRPVLMPTHQKTDTFLLRTHEGTTGVLQVLGAADDDRSVRIRYKLVQPPVALPAQTAVPPVAGAGTHAGISHP